MARINSRQVEAFRAMMLTGSVTEAAKLMAVTQPAVSRLLRDFQALLKMELFEKRGTGLVPMAAATALYMEVERSFVGLERITAAAEEIRSRRTGTLRIAAKVTLQPRDFEGETFVSLTTGSTGRHLIDQAFNRDDVRRVLRVETNLSEIMCGMVSSGLGVAICDPFTAQEFANRGVVVRRFVPRIDFEFAAVFPPQRSPSPVALDLLEAMRQALAELDGPVTRRTSETNSFELQTGE